MFEFNSVVASSDTSEELVQLLASKYPQIQPLVEKLAQELGVRIFAVGLDYLLLSSSVSFALVALVEGQMIRPSNEELMQELCEQISDAIDAWLVDVEEVLGMHPLNQHVFKIGFNNEDGKLNIFTSAVVAGSMLERILQL